ncbi:DNA internalization-related competence protein ComEC/Rec2 [Pseudomonas sp. RIT-PI-S]|uniref:DNA internalization-related competence protein ComEC/Rec2 n=1 Tax=Pseudomonas sp. RIT-PI-S TaxID=3035295 RepID=UPI0021D9CAA9|nr:DNA internalization-related competence protein ComEC/Rec2 [Pseudomonas sp. RIT-PI-S]
MRPALLAFAFGVLGARWWPGLPPAWLVALFGAGGLVLAGVAQRAGKWLGWVLFGLAWALWAALRMDADRLAIDLNNRTLWLEGVVVGLPAQSARSVRFELGDAVSRRAALPSRLRLSWYGGPPVRSGERWRLAVTLATPRGQVNPGGFDYEAWLFARGIGATGSVKDGQRIDGERRGPREAIRQRLLESQAHPRLGMLAALVLGDDAGVSPEQWRLLQATGTVHLFVISGQHVGLLAGLVYGLIAGLARLGWWPRRWPWLPWACGCACMAAVGYGALAGFEVPVQRACLMICVTLLWRWRFRHLGVFTPLLLALATVLALNPLVSLTPGFWLSFAAVAVLLFGFSGRLGAWSWWQGLVRAQWQVALGLSVIMSALGLAISLSGPWVNLFAVPWISLVVLPLALAGTVELWLPWGGGPLLWLAGSALDILLGVLTPLGSALPAWLAPQLPLSAWVLASFGALLLLLPAGVPLRWLGLPLILQLPFAPLPKPPWGQAQVVQLDVGQGLAILVRTRRHALVFDAGPRYGNGDAGEQVVVPSLRRLGVRRLDAFVLSHAHVDHSGGGQALINALAPTRVMAGEPQQAPRRWKAEACQDAQPWEWDGVRFKPWRWAAAKESNPSSCVLLVEANGERLLLTGDIDASAERALLKAWPGLTVNWLQVPHHGSGTSSSAVFLDALAPSGVLISRGWNNRFRHPHPHVLARLAQRAIRPMDSALHGAVQVHLGRGSAPEYWRQRPRLWRATSGSGGG